MANLSSSTSRRHRLVQGLVSGLFSRSPSTSPEQPTGSPPCEAPGSIPSQTASIASSVPSSTLIGSPELPSSLPSASPYRSHNPATSTSWVVLPVVTSPTSSSDPSYAFPAPPSLDSASSSTASLVPSVQPASSSIAVLWQEAIARYKSKTGVDLCAKQDVPFDSESSIFQYLDEHQRNFEAFHEGGLQCLRKSLTPVVAVLGPLCTIVGEAVGLAFQPSKAIFAAVGELCKGAVEAGDELDAISDAFDTMAHHLRILKPASAHVLEDDTLREASVKLLAQILVVLGVIRKVWKQGRLVLWLKKLAKSKAVASALADLSRLASTHHETVSAVTLYTAKETMALLTESNAWSQEEQEVTRSSLASITKIAQDVYVMVREYAGLASDEQRANRGILEHIQRALLRQINDMSIVKKTAEIEKIFAWLHCPDSSVKMNSLLDDRAMSTGSWFLDGEEFTSFKKGAITVLWLHGKAGCGKSTMIAAAIRDLQAEAATSGDAPSITLSHLFDTTGSSPRNLRAFLSSLLCQLAYNIPECACRLIQQRASSGHSQVSLQEMRHNLDVTLKATPLHIFIVVDALDEADDPAVVPFLENLRIHSNVSLMFSSRYEVFFRADLEALSGARVAMNEDLVTGDIKTLLDGHLAKGGLLGRVADTDLVRDSLSAGADGNFRWTVLQVKGLINVAGIPSQVRERLERSPRTLAKLYDQVLAGIFETGAPEPVRRLLAWAILAVKPLTIDEFAHLMSFEYFGRMPVYDASLNSSADYVIALVGSTFLALRDEEVRVAHASVKDHLLDPPADSLACPATRYFHIDPNEDYASMTRTCLAYINANVDCFRSQNRVHHLIWTWVFYFAKVDLDRDRDLEQDVIDALAHTGQKDVATISLYAAVQIGSKLLTTLLIDRLGANVEGRAESLRAVRFTSVLFNGQLSEATAPILVDSVVDAPVERRYTPLHLAAYHDKIELVRLLVDRGAKIDAAEEEGWTPLRLAMVNRHLDVALFLVEQGAPDAEVDAALFIAVSQHDVEAARLLLEHGAAIRREATDWDPLQTAAQSGNLTLIRLLLDYGADVRACSRRQETALHIAAQGGHLETVRLFLDLGADLHARGGPNSETPLHYAARSENPEVIRLLLDCGGDAQACSRAQHTSLHIAAREGHLEAARYLLDHGADVNARNIGQSTPYHMTFEYCHREVAQLLVDRGADVDAREFGGGTSLHNIARIGRLEAARLLLDHGADIEAHNSMQWTPLRVAAHNGHLEIVRLLLDHDANIEARANKQSTTLHLATQDGHFKIVQLLLDHGADVEARDEQGLTPLLYAAQENHVGVARLLIGRGAAVNAPSDSLWTALHLATQEGHFEVAQLLLDHGANVEAREEARWTPLNLAAQHGRLEFAKLLFDRGADIQARTRSGLSPLHMATYNCMEEVVRLLIDLQSDVNARDNGGETPLDLLGESPKSPDDPPLCERIRHMLLQAGATESSARPARPLQLRAAQVSLRRPKISSSMRVSAKCRACKSVRVREVARTVVSGSEGAVEEGEGDKLACPCCLTPIPIGQRGRILRQ